MSTTTDKALAMSKDSKLQISIGGKEVGSGAFVSKNDIKSHPEIIFPEGGGPYIVACLDLDAPYPMAKFLSPVLHWIQPGMRVAEGTSTGALTSADTPFIADWATPGPPPPSGPHRYVIMLFEQPSDFDYKKFAPTEGKSFPVMKRVRYDFDKFIKEAKLGPMVAANFFKSN